MLKYSKMLLSFSIVAMMFVICRFQVTAVEVNVNYPDLDVNFNVNVPDKVAIECLNSKYWDEYEYDDDEDYEYLLQYYLPLCTKWLNSLKHDQIRFFKAYMATRELMKPNRNEFLLAMSFARQKRGEPVLFGFCSFEDRIVKYRAERDLMRYEQGDEGFLDEISIPCWSGWEMLLRFDFRPFESFTSLLEINIPLQRYLCGANKISLALI